MPCVLAFRYRMGGRFMPAYYRELVVGQMEERAVDDEDGSPDGPDGTGVPSSSLDALEVELFAFKSSWDVVKACDRLA